MWTTSGLASLRRVVTSLKYFLYGKSFLQLPRHQRFSIAHANDFAILDPLDLRGVRIRNFSATDDGDFQHFSARFRFACSFRNSDSFLQG